MREVALAAINLLTGVPLCSVKGVDEWHTVEWSARRKIGDMDHTIWIAHFWPVPLMCWDWPPAMWDAVEISWSWLVLGTTLLRVKRNYFFGMRSHYSVNCLRILIEVTTSLCLTYRRNKNPSALYIIMFNAHARRKGSGSKTSGRRKKLFACSCQMF